MASQGASVTGDNAAEDIGNDTLAVVVSGNRDGTRNAKDDRWGRIHDLQGYLSGRDVSRLILNGHGDGIVACRK